ncbi:hypothetical protein, partial [Streptococcus gallolyticus]|uniref:hypothetical protein n=1 Tax=Streptococcus gallolyticus TaxID=315405 RepID=UPI001E55C1EA
LVVNSKNWCCKLRIIFKKLQKMTSLHNSFMSDVSHKFSLAWLDKIVTVVTSKTPKPFSAGR